MKSYLIVLILGAFFISFTACKTSEVTSEPPVESKEEESQEEVVTQEAEEQNPDKEIVLVVNGVVKYTFVKSNSNWKGLITQYNSPDPDSQEVVRILEIEPTMGWDDFESFINYMKIYDIPDQSEIEDRKVGNITDISRAYQFYTFDGEHSRSYSYYNPEGELNEHWQSRNVVTFGTYLISEMKVVQ